MPDGHLLGSGAAVLRQPALRFSHLRAPLVHDARSRLDVGLVGRYRGGLSFGGGGNLVVLLPRNFFVGDQDLVARQVGLGARVIGFGFGQFRGGRVAIVLRGAEGGFGAQRRGLARRNVGRVLHLRDRYVRLLRRHHAARLGQLRLAWSRRHLEIARIQIHQRIARFHHLVIFDVDLRAIVPSMRALMGFRCTSTWASSVVFKLPHMQPVDEPRRRQNEQHEEENQECAAAASGRAASLGRRGYGGRRCHSRFAVQQRGVAVLSRLDGGAAG